MRLSVQGTKQATVAFCWSLRSGDVSRSAVHGGGSRTQPGEREVEPGESAGAPVLFSVHAKPGGQWVSDPFLRTEILVCLLDVLEENHSLRPEVCRQ